MDGADQTGSGFHWRCRRNDGERNRVVLGHLVASAVLHQADRDALFRLGRCAAVATINLPLRERRSGLFGVEVVGLGNCVSLSLENGFKLQHVGPVAANVESAEERKVAIHRIRGTTVERENRVTRIDVVAILYRDGADLAIDWRVNGLRLVATQHTVDREDVVERAPCHRLRLDDQPTHCWRIDGGASDDEHSCEERYDADPDDYFFARSHNRTTHFP